ncbi:hypothetical protein UA08_08408 [Talaromyces atroroseus]|uniref:Uncharacterized protein n=1 Tax=Talaromyces atroroseus TaxID=1441469 RepID=A0A1Q5Q7L5_TALAT|nr:hypothetical protein UA08_08408 [Talaromyces atroroseus]OKL56203.1 hypothetical protein UA08_08408 [Talaromyces atroroseus]
MQPSLQQVGLHSNQRLDDIAFVPYWARCQVQYAQNLLDYSPEPIEYDYHDDDGWETCFFFPEDCTRAPASYPSDASEIETDADTDLSVKSDLSDADANSDDNMTPSLPDIKMIDTEALSDLLEDNLAPPQITSILIFATNGAIFAYASKLSTRQLRNLSATYGAAYTSFARTASTGNLTGVKHASHPSSFVTAPSISLGDVGSIVFEHENQVAVVTRIADKVLLAAVGPEKLPQAVEESKSAAGPGAEIDSNVESAESAPAGEEASSSQQQQQQQHVESPSPSSSLKAESQQQNGNSLLATQYQIDRDNDLARLAALNLSSSPEILLALESKSAALGRFLRQKLQDLESPEDF